jgi:hypothetical protein
VASDRTAPLKPKSGLNGPPASEAESDTEYTAIVERFGGGICWRWPANVRFYFAVEDRVPSSRGAAESDFRRLTHFFQCP